MPKRLLKSGMTMTGITYYIYEDTDSRVFAETLSCRYYLIAEDINAFYRVSMMELERKIYNAEMGNAR